MMGSNGVTLFSNLEDDRQSLIVRAAWNDDNFNQSRLYHLLDQIGNTNLKLAIEAAVIDMINEAIETSYDAGLYDCSRNTQYTMDISMIEKT